MSSYENYTETSKNYDRTREPVGMEIIIGCMAHAPAPLHEARILDAGCGTGSYTAAMLSYVGKVEAVDLNPGMLEVAGEKLSAAREEGRVSFHSSRIDDLPFDDATLDGVMINQVLHHLPDDPTEGFPAHRRVFEEFARVLKPGGTLTVNTCTQEQLRHGYWYYDLIPQAAEALRTRFAPADRIAQILQDCGLDYRGRFAPTDARIQGNSYQNPHGPLKKEWRDGDSTWSLVSDKELEQALFKIRDLDGEGWLEGYVEHQDARRRDIGQITILFASRR